MTTKIQPTFTRTKTAVAVGAALFVVAGASIAAYEPRTPVAGVDDSATSNGTDAVTIDVLANDGAVDSSTLTIATQPAGGTAEVVGSAIVFTPNASFSGTDTFTYQVTETDWRSAESTTNYSLDDLNANPPIATSYVAVDGNGAPLDPPLNPPIVNGGTSPPNSDDQSNSLVGSWNDGPVSTQDPGVIGKSYSINETVKSISGCNADDINSPIASLTMVWSGRRQGVVSGTGDNQFTITSDAAPSPAVDAGGTALRVHLNSANGVSINGSSVQDTRGTIVDGANDWDFDATAIWTDLTSADIESTNVSILASLYNGKQWFNNGATFDLAVDLSNCSNLHTSTATVTITDDSDGDGGGSSGGGGGGAFSGVTLFVLSLLGLGALGRRRKQ